MPRQTRRTGPSWGGGEGVQGSRHPTPVRAGFTIIEVVIAVVILGIVATMALAPSPKAQRRAEAIKLQGDLTSVASATEAAYDRTGQGYPTGLTTWAHVQTGVAVTVDGQTSWHVSSYAADDRGAVLQARWDTDNTLVCTVGLGSQAPVVPMSCTGE